jgi:PadR family transcriptional regulator, regulatory protein PadR
LLTSEGTAYPLLNRLRDAGLVTSRRIHGDQTRPRRYYSITDQGREHLAAFRADWSAFTAAVDGVLGIGTDSGRSRRRAPPC